MLNCIITETARLAYSVKRLLMTIDFPSSKIIWTKVKNEFFPMIEFEGLLFKKLEKMNLQR